MVFAKTPEVAAKLSDMQQDGEIAKYYQAVITGELPDFEGEMVDYLLRDGKTNTTKVVKKAKRVPSAQSYIMRCSMSWIRTMERSVMC